MAVADILLVGSAVVNGGAASLMSCVGGAGSGVSFVLAAGRCAVLIAGSDSVLTACADVAGADDMLAK